MPTLGERSGPTWSRRGSPPSAGSSSSMPFLSLSFYNFNAPANLKTWPPSKRTSASPPLTQRLHFQIRHRRRPLRRQIRHSHPLRSAPSLTQDDQFSEHYKSTIGVDFVSLPPPLITQRFRTLKVGPQTAKLQIVRASQPVGHSRPGALPNHHQCLLQGRGRSGRGLRHDEPGELQARPELDRRSALDRGQRGTNHGPGQQI